MQFKYSIAVVNFVVFVKKYFNTAELLLRFLPLYILRSKVVYRLSKSAPKILTSSSYRNPEIARYKAPVDVVVFL